MRLPLAVLLHAALISLLVLVVSAAWYWIGSLPSKTDLLVIGMWSLFCVSVAAGYQASRPEGPRTGKRMDVDLGRDPVRIIERTYGTTQDRVRTEDLVPPDPPRW